MRRIQRTVSQRLRVTPTHPDTPAAPALPLERKWEGRETPHHHYPEIVTGHFHEGPGYAAYREFGTDDFPLVYTVSGRGRFGYRTGEFICKPGDLVMLRPGAFHDYGVEPQLQRWELLW